MIRIPLRKVFLRNEQRNINATDTVRVTWLPEAMAVEVEYVDPANPRITVLAFAEGVELDLMPREERPEVPAGEHVPAGTDGPAGGRQRKGRAPTG